jgi:hypothetical protein
MLFFGTMIVDDFQFSVVDLIFCFSNGVGVRASSGPEVKLNWYMLVVLEFVQVLEFVMKTYKCIIMVIIFLINVIAIFFMWCDIVVVVVSIEQRDVSFLKASFSVVDSDHEHVDSVLEFFLFCCRLFVRTLGKIVHTTK